LNILFCQFTLCLSNKKSFNCVITFLCKIFSKSVYSSKLHSLNVVIIRIETGRYENKNVNERVCFICHDQIEDEKHVLLYCPLNADLRERLFNEVKRSNVHSAII
jgi:hypothetical protein